MEIRLANPLARALVLLLVVPSALALAVPAARMALAEHRAGANPPDAFERAIRLEPNNADYWYRLGSYWALDFEHADPLRAVEAFQRAVELDPNSAEYWMDYGSALEVGGRSREAEAAFARARACYPLSAEVTWRYGNFLLREGKPDAAFAEIRRAVNSDPRLIPPATALIWRVTQDPTRLLDLLPHTLSAYRSARDSFLRNDMSEPALVVWNGMIALGVTLELRDSFGLIDRLVLEEHIDQAWSVWKQALAASGISFPRTTDGSLITDGSFETEPAGGGFGWRLDPVLGATFDFDSSIAHAGNRSLRITFDGGTNVDFEHVWQYVAVQPNTRYRFRGWLRTDSISTESGIRFFINDTRHINALNVLTPALTGTANWTPFETEFTTGPKTEVLRVGLRRLPSFEFDNKIQGTVWVDEISLTPAASEASSR